MIRIGVIVAVVLLGACADDGPADDTSDTAPRTDRPAATDDDPATPPSPPTETSPTTEATSDPRRPATAPSVLTESDQGTYLLGRDGRTSIRLDPGSGWETPTVSDPTVVEVFRVLAEEDPGYIEWMVEGRGPGEARVTFVDATGLSVEFVFIVDG